MPNVSFTDHYSQDYAELARQRKIAEILAQQGAEPIGNTEMVGGWAIPQGALPAINKLTQSGLSAFMNYKAGEREKMLAEKVREGGKKDATDFISALQGSPAKPSTYQADTFDEADKEQLSMDMGTPAVASDKNRALAIALGSGNPMVQQAGSSIMAEMLKGQKEAEPYSLSPGQVRYGPDNKQIASVPLAETNKPQLVTVYGADGIPMQKWLRPGEAEGTQVGMGKPEQQSDIARLIAEMNQLPPGDARRKVYQNAISKATTHAPASQMINMGAPQSVLNPVTGQPELVQFGNKPGAKPQFTGLAPAPDTSKPPTESEAKAAFYAQNMQAASAVIDELEKKGLDLTKIGDQAATALAGGFTNPIASKQGQQARQAQRQWAEQMLRMQTGAAATQDEIDRTQATYFPSIGDSKEVVDQKRAMRQQAESGVFEASGRAKGRVPQRRLTGAPQASKDDAYKEYVDAYKRATPEQRKAINARAREMGVIK